MIIHLCNKNTENRGNKDKHEVVSYAYGLVVSFKRAGPRRMLRCASVVNASCRGTKNKTREEVEVEVRVNEGVPKQAPANKHPYRD